jgi:hypothetical protein
VVHGTIHRYIEGGESATVIYLIDRDGDTLVETDDLEFVRNFVSENQDCSVRDARTGKKVPLE